MLLLERTQWNQGVYADMHATTSMVSDEAITGAICAEIGIILGILAILAIVQHTLPAVERAGRHVAVFIAIVCGSVALIFCWVPVLPLFVALPASIAGSIGFLRARPGIERRILSRTGLALGGMALASAVFTTLLEAT